MNARQRPRFKAWQEVLDMDSATFSEPLMVPGRRHWLINDVEVTEQEFRQLFDQWREPVILP